MSFYRRYWILTLLISFVCVSHTWAQSFLDPAAYALQSRKYHLKHEFNFSAGFLPLDAFEKGYGLNFSYVYHFNDAFALELPQIMGIANRSTGLQQDLERLFALSAVDPNTDTDRDSKAYVITANAIFKPVYRKMLFFNKKIMYGEGYVIAGGGFFKFDSGFKPTADVGIGVRLYINPTLSLKTEIRDYLVFDQLSPKNEPAIMVGLSFNRGGQKTK